MDAKLTPFQRAALEYMARPNSGSTATWWFAHHPNPPCRSTKHAYQVLRSLAKLGLMKGIEATRSGRVYWWQITELGRAEYERSASQADREYQFRSEQ